MSNVKEEFRIPLSNKFTKINKRQPSERQLTNLFLNIHAIATDVIDRSGLYLELNEELELYADKTEEEMDKAEKKYIENIKEVYRLEIEAMKALIVDRDLKEYRLIIKNL